MIYFKSKYLADKLGINPAKWKRWSREFLDPDPLGGYQSGFARQFSFKHAFRVFLGGHLVGRLYFTIPQARQILLDLHLWLKKNQFYVRPKTDGVPPASQRRIYIYETGRGRYAYEIRHIASATVPKEDGQQAEVYGLELLGVTQEVLAGEGFTHARMIRIDTLHQQFRHRIDDG